MKVKTSFQGEFKVFSFEENNNKIGFVFIKLKHGWNQLHIDINKNFQHKDYAKKLIGYVVDKIGYVNIPVGRIINPNVFKVIEKMKKEYDVTFNEEFKEWKISKKELKETMLKEEDILDTKIKNPETGREIKVSSALGYDQTEPVYKKAKALVQKGDKTADVTPTADKIEQPKKKINSRSHKKAGRQFGINKEIKELLKSKGFPMLTAFPQTFVKPDELVFNPKLNDKNKNSIWVLKFPALDKLNRVVTKTVYTPEFMLKSKVKNFKKISRIKSTDIETFDEKTKKLLRHKNKDISDAAAVIRIVLKTGLRIGSLDNPDTGSIGTRTLQVKNLSMKGSKIRFDFIGKSAQENIAEFDDVDVANYLQKAIKGKKPEDRIFGVSYAHTARLMEKINPKGINPKDLRAYKATSISKIALKDNKFGPPLPLAKDKKELKKQVKEKLKKVFDYVSTVLNNTPTMAKNSYVHPVVITDWLDTLGLKPKEVGYKHVMVKDSKLYSQEKQLIESSILILKTIKENKSLRKQSLMNILKIAQTKTDKKIKSFAEAVDIINKLNEAFDEPKWTTMDEMFEKYSNYGDGIDYSDISDEDSYECEEYPIPDWYFDDNIELVNLNNESE